VAGHTFWCWLGAHFAVPDCCVCFSFEAGGVWFLNPFSSLGLLPISFCPLQVSSKDRPLAEFVKGLNTPKYCPNPLEVALTWSVRYALKIVKSVKTRHHECDIPPNLAHTLQILASINYSSQDNKKEDC
jgi:hypothetical protein